MDEKARELSNEELSNEVKVIAEVVKRTYEDDERISLLCRVCEHRGCIKVNVFCEDNIGGYRFEVGDIFSGRGSIYFRRLRDSDKYSIEFRIKSIDWYKNGARDIDEDISEVDIKRIKEAGGYEQKRKWYQKRKRG